MEPRYGSVKLKVPTAFPILLQRFTREVLREQPQNIAEFGANYFQSLVIERKVTGEDPLAGDPFDQPGFHASSQNILRPISSKVRLEEIKREKAATKIQAGYKGYRVRRASRLEQKPKQDLQKQHHAATKIQAQYRGYRTRKNVRKPSPEVNVPPAQEQFTTENLKEYDDEEKNAAVRIQASFRGYMARKSMKQEGQEEKKQGQEEVPEIRVEESENIASETERDQDVAAEPSQLAEIPEQEEKVADSQDFQETVDNKQDLDTQDKAEDESTEPDKLEKEAEDETSTAGAKQAEEAAAVKIQASFRGHQTRKQLKEQAKQPVEQDENKFADNDITTEFAEVNSSTPAHTPRQEYEETAPTDMLQKDLEEYGDLPLKDDEEAAVGTPREEAKQGDVSDLPRDLEEQVTVELGEDEATSATEDTRHEEGELHDIGSTPRAAEQETADDDIPKKEESSIPNDASHEEKEAYHQEDTSPKEGSPRATDQQPVVDGISGTGRKLSGMAYSQHDDDEEESQSVHDTPRIAEEESAENFASDKDEQVAAAEDISQKNEELVSTESTSDEKREAAALKIQTRYRGYRTRMSVKSMEEERNAATVDSNEA